MQCEFHTYTAPSHMDLSQLNGRTSLVAIMDGSGIDSLISTGVLSELSVLPGPRTGAFCAFSACTHRAFNEGIYLPSHSKTTVKTKQGVWHWSRLMEPQGVMGFPGGSDGKESACNAGHPDSIPGLGRCPGEGHGNPLQYSCLENSTDRGAWWATGHGVTKSQTRLSYEHVQHVQAINLFVFLFFVILIIF